MAWIGISWAPKAFVIEHVCLADATVTISDVGAGPFSIGEHVCDEDGEEEPLHGSACLSLEPVAGFKLVAEWSFRFGVFWSQQLKQLGKVQSQLDKDRAKNTRFGSGGQVKSESRDLG